MVTQLSSRLASVGSDRIQMWRCALSCQHATTEAFRISCRSWKLLGKHRLLLQSPQRDEYDVIVNRRDCARAAYAWKDFSQTQTGRALRRDRRNNCCVNASVGDAWPEINWRGAPGNTSAESSSSLLA